MDVLIFIGIGAGLLFLFRHRVSNTGTGTDWRSMVGFLCGGIKKLSEFLTEKTGEKGPTVREREEDVK